MGVLLDFLDMCAEKDLKFQDGVGNVPQEDLFALAQSVLDGVAETEKEYASAARQEEEMLAKDKVFGQKAQKLGLQQSRRQRRHKGLDRLISIILQECRKKDVDIKGLDFHGFFVQGFTNQQGKLLRKLPDPPEVT